jgi:hypothetical protein
MFILVILYDLSLLLAQFWYVILYIQRVESRAQIADRCAPWKISSSVVNLLLQSLQF